LVNIDNTLANLSLAKNAIPANLAEKFYAQNLEELFFCVKPYPGAKDMMDNLSDFAEIVYTTARPKIADFVTVRWLEINGFPDGKIMFVHPQDRYFPDASGVIDDDPRVSLLYKVEWAKRIYIKAQPYNKKVRGCRFKDWFSFIDAIDQLYRLETT
jgi:hypothetical protein